MAGFGQVLGTIVGTAASPQASIVDAAKGIIGMFKLDPTKKAELEAQLTAENIDLEKTQLAGVIAQLQGQLDTDKAEAASKSVFVAGWRPWIGWVCGSAFAWAYVLQPFCAFALSAFHVQVMLPTLDLSEMMPVLLGMLGLGGLRTYEKVQNAPGAKDLQ